MSRISVAEVGLVYYTGALEGRHAEDDRSRGACEPWLGNES